MTDTNSLIPNQTAVSSDCLYNLKPSSVRARSYRASIPASNKSTFIPQDVGIYYVPGGRRNTYLDTQQTYIRFTVQNLDGTGAGNYFNTDVCGACFINRIDIFHGSNLLETIQQYNVLFIYLLDFQFSQSAKQGLSTMYGTCHVAGTANTRLGRVCASANTQKLTFCMPLLGMIGLGSDKLIPIGALSDDIRLEVTWEAGNYAVFYNAAPNAYWQIVSSELDLTIIELSDEGQSMVESVTPFSQPLYIHGNSWRHYVSTLTAASSGSQSFLVPARFASLKGLHICPRRNSDQVQASYSLGSRLNPNIQSYWLRVGAYLIPNKMVILNGASSTGGYAEAYAEVVKTFHSLTIPQYASGITAELYNVQDAVIDATTGGGVALLGGVLGPYAVGVASCQNAFAIAQELESFAQRSDILISGMNTLASQIFFEFVMSAAIGASAYTLDYFANYDHILVLQNGLLSVKF